MVLRRLTPESGAHGRVTFSATWGWCWWRDLNCRCHCQDPHPTSVGWLSASVPLSTGHRPQAQSMGCTVQCASQGSTISKPPNQCRGVSASVPQGRGSGRSAGTSANGREASLPLSRGHSPQWPQKRVIRFGAWTKGPQSAGTLTSGLKDLVP